MLYSHQNTDYADMLGCTFIHHGNDYDNITEILGVDGGFAVDDAFNHESGSDEDYRIDRLGAGDGELLLECNNGYNRVVTYDAGGYRVIVSSVVIGALGNEGLSTRASLMARYLAFLNGVEGPEIEPAQSELDFGIAYTGFENTFNAVFLTLVWKISSSRKLPFREMVFPPTHVRHIRLHRALP